MVTSPSDDLTRDRLLIEIPLREGYKTLGPVVLYRRLGKGGMGTVYLGRHLRLQHDVAVKCLSHDLADDERFVRRFRSEASAAARLNHPNIVRVFDVDEDSRLHFLIMEYVDGESVGDRVRRKGPLAEEEALTIALGAAQGLAHAHAEGFVHRDVKPDNLLISRKGEVKVADLGLAKPLDDVGRSMSAGSGALGTPAFMAPEQARSSAELSLSVDVYALGATLYWTLTARHPFEGKDVLELLGKVVKDPFPDVRALRPDVSAATAALIERCTRKDPAQRPADAGELVRLLTRPSSDARTVLIDPGSGRLGETAPLVSPPPEQVLSRIQLTLGSDPKRSTSAPARRPWRTAGALVALVGLLAAAWFGILDRGRSLTREDSVDVEGHAAASRATDGESSRPASSELRVSDWAEVIENRPDPEVVTDAAGRARMEATGLPWMVRDRGSGIVMLLVPPGTYRRGASPGDSEAYGDENPAHDVRVAEPFYLGRTEVTQEEWQRIAGSNPSVRKGSSLPVTDVSFETAQSVLQRAGLRLPRESEWEYACRAGSTGARHGALDQIAWHGGNSGRQVRPVAGKLSNAWGFHDMLGNVWEWCDTRYDFSFYRNLAGRSQPVDSKADDEARGVFPVERGGSWYGTPRIARSSFRNLDRPSFALDDDGLRAARTP